MEAQTRWRITRAIATSLYLFIGWLLFSGSFSLVSLATGAAFSVLVASLTHTFFIAEHEAERRALLPRIDLLFVFGVVLVFKMYIASFKVLFDLLRGRVNPRIVHFRTRLHSDIARVMLANAITMTPGTLTIELDDDHLVVHWLEAVTTHSRHAGGLIMGLFESILRRIWV